MLKRVAGQRPPKARHAITDLYDEERRAFRVRFPAWLIILLGLAGVAAFALVGFFGYPEGHLALDGAIRQPWPLFLWFSALMVTLIVLIFRDPSLRRRLIAMLVFAALAILLVGLIYFSKSLPDIIQQILGKHVLLKLLAGNAWTYAILNFGLIGVFWADTIRRWVRRSRGLAPNPHVNIGEGFGADAEDMPSLQELISGDLMAGAVLALLLGLLFRAELLAPALQSSGITLNTCTVSLPFSACHGFGGGPFDPPTLTFVDLIQALIYLPLGLMILAFAATVSGLGAVGGVNEKAVAAFGLPGMPTSTQAQGKSSTAIATDVATTVLDTIQAALDRRARLLARNLVLSLRMIGWPTLLVGASRGLAELSTGIQLYLHSGKGIGDVAADILPAAIWAVVTVLSIVFSAALMLFRWRVAENTLRFLGLVGFVVLLTFWIFSLALWGFNQLLLQTHALDRTPFTLGGATALSFGALVLFGGYIVVSGMGKPKKAQPAIAPMQEELDGARSGVSANTIAPSESLISSPTASAAPQQGQSQS